jgi:hypothetical protein
VELIHLPASCSCEKFFSARATFNRFFKINFSFIKLPPVNFII